MRVDERELAALRLRQIADEVGLELSSERLDSLVARLESTVAGTRAAGELVLEDELPLSLPDFDREEIS